MTPLNPSCPSSWSISRLRLLACFGFALATASLCAQTSPTNTTTNSALRVGAFTLTPPATWRATQGSETDQLKAQIKQGIDQTIAQYKSTTGAETPLLGMQDFQALQFDAKGGWCIVHSMRIPPVKDYYATMREDTQRKIEWGLSRGIFEKVTENGTTKVGTNTVLKSVFQQKGGGRMIQIAYWNAAQPSHVTQLLILQNIPDSKLTTEVDACVKSLTVR